MARKTVMAERSLVEEAGTGRRPGRPRSADAHAAILAAARALLEEGGYEAVTMEAVAARAGVGKATVYRRYANRPELVADAVMDVLAGAVPGKDRGSLRADLKSTIEGLTGPHAPRTADVFLRLATEALHDESVRRIFNDELLAARRAVAAGLLDRAGARGEMTRPIDPDTLLDLVGGALLFRAARRGGHVDARFRRELLDLLVAGLSSPAPIQPKRRRPAAPTRSKSKEE